MIRLHGRGRLYAGSIQCQPRTRSVDGYIRRHFQLLGDCHPHSDPIDQSQKILSPSSNLGSHLLEDPAACLHLHLLVLDLHLSSLLSSDD